MKRIIGLIICIVFLVIMSVSAVGCSLIEDLIFPSEISEETESSGGSNGNGGLVPGGTYIAH